MRFLQGAVYHAARGFLHHLLAELPEPDWIGEDLVGLFNGENLPGPQPVTARPEAVHPKSDKEPGQGPYWVRNVWTEPFILEFDSISKAAKALRGIQRNWAPCPVRLHRRSALIVEALPPLKPKPFPFPSALPNAPMGAFTLLDEHHLLGSAATTSPFPNGAFEFVEDKFGPPSRAYRKLWEALLLARRLPRPGDRCLDAGACPGGWTWVLASLGADVTAVDRAPLDPRIEAMQGVRWMRHDAFTLKPRDLGPVDWLCSDVICYPEALYEWIESWIAEDMAKNFICTIKMQGETFDAETVRRFSLIPGSRILHLWHNRHELTWIRLRDDEREPAAADSFSPSEQTSP